MHKTTFVKIILAIIIITGANNCHAQDTLAGKQDTITNRFPKAILVQLRSEHNRMAALTKARQYKELAGLKKDAINVASRMTADFHDNLNFCPVYYYMDTNLDLIKERKFDGVLFNADGSPAINTVINDTSKDYLIIFYGYPVSQSRNTDEVTDPDKYSHDSGEPMGKGLVINNYKFHQISFLYKLDYENFVFRLKRGNKKYIYVSKHYDMEYFPFAEILNQKLKTRLRNTNYVNTVMFE